jgi:hypothetical protein
LQGQNEADRVKIRQILESTDISAADQEAIYHWIENSKSPLTPEQKAVYESDIKPISEERNRLFAKLRNDGIPVDNDGYTPRHVADRGGIIDRLQQGYKGAMQGGLLRKTTGEFKHRVMMAIEDAQGNRRVVSIRQGRVVWYHDKKADYIGSMDSRGSEYPDFVDNNKKAWKVVDATTKEIEANTNVSYHKTLLLNELDSWHNLRKVDRAIEYLENLKNDPEFSRVAIKLGTQNIPDGYKTTILPQFRGYAFPNRIAETFDTLFKNASTGLLEPGNMYSTVNSILRNAIFFNPFIHIPNITVHAIVNRGVLPLLNPKRYLDLMRASTKAISATLTMNQDYVDALEKGAPLLYSKTVNKDLYQLMLDKMGNELKQDQPLLKKIGDALGYVNPYNLVKAIYNFSGKATWSINDIAMLESIYEDMGEGLTMDQAIKETGKHIPTYRIPARVLNSTTVSKLMKSESGVTMFGAYHYGALKSYGEMIKSLLGKVPMKERMGALDKIAMLVLITYFVYPELDKIAKKMTGNKNAYFRRAGATTFPYKTQQLITGRIRFSDWVQSVLTPSIGLQFGVQMLSGRDWRTGQKISPLQTAVQSVSPTAYAQRLKTGKLSGRDFAAGLVGVSSPKKGPKITSTPVFNTGGRRIFNTTSGPTSRRIFNQRSAQ